MLLEELAGVGSAALEMLFEDMEAHGFRFREDQSYSLAHLHSFFSTLFGEDGADIIMERIIKNMSHS